jgi:Family of unknown function (DUF6510)
MADTDLRLDGNAVAGILGEIFVQDMTTASIKCGGCGEVELLGAEHVYMRAPGTVMRCCHCEGVLLVIMERDDRFVLGF